MWARFVVSNEDAIRPLLREKGWDQQSISGLVFGKSYIVVGLSIVHNDHSLVLIAQNELSERTDARFYPLEFFEFDSIRSLPARWKVGSTVTTIDSGRTTSMSLNMGYPELVEDSAEVSRIFGRDIEARTRIDLFVRTEIRRQDARDAISSFDRGDIDVDGLGAWAVQKIDSMDRESDAHFPNILLRLMDVEQAADPDRTSDELWRSL